MPHTWDPNVPTPEEALHRLIEGNRRFLGRSSAIMGATDGRPSVSDAALDQRPFAIVLGCSDSRTPVEILFDQGLGDLFVVRVAGHVVAPSVVGSIEFAAAQFGTRLVVVLGHTRCGAVSAAVHTIETQDDPDSRNMRAIIDRIVPNIDSLVRSRSPTAPDHDVLVREAMRAHVHAAANHLRHSSRLLEELVLAGRVLVVGAEYDLDTGEVLFIDGVATRPPARTDRP